MSKACRELEPLAAPTAKIEDRFLTRAKESCFDIRQVNPELGADVGQGAAVLVLQAMIEGLPQGIKARS